MSGPSAPWLIRCYPLLNKALKSLGKASSLADAISHEEEICPAETAPGPRVLMLDDDWDRITAVQHETTPEAERRRIKGGPTLHRATIRREFHNVLATERGCYTAGKTFNNNGMIPIRRLLREPIARAKNGIFALPPIAMTYFGHWLLDALPMTLLAREDETVYLPSHPGWPHSQAYLKRLGLSEPTQRMVCFERLAVFDDIGMNASRRSRLRQIRDRLRDSLPITSAPHAGVVIRRGDSGSSRVLTNEQALCEQLVARGFRDCAVTDDLDHILDCCANAQVIVSMEGSHLAHAFLAALPGALILSLNPADRFNTVYADYLPALGHRMATMVVARNSEGYDVDIQRLLEFLDRLQSEFIGG